MWSNSDPNSVQSIKLATEALDVARRLGEVDLEAPVWNNLGHDLKTRGQLIEALECFGRARDAALKKPASTQAYVASTALANIAACAFLLGNISSGLQWALESIECNLHPTGLNEAHGRILAEVNCVRLLIALGDFAGAEAHVAAAKYFTEHSGDRALSRMQASAAGALLDVAVGRIESGLARLTENVALARRSSRTELMECLADCVLGFEMAGQPDVALQYLEHMLDHQKESVKASIVIRLGLAETDPAAFETHWSDRATRLRTHVDSSAEEVINAAINAALAAGHDLYRVFRVAKLAEIFAEYLGWPNADRQTIALAGKLYDVGMLAVPTPLLTKTRALSAGEQSLLYEHTRTGAELLSNAGLAVFQQCAPIARYHHERWDGLGPHRLRGEAIPITARVVALADGFDAIVHRRPWRNAMTPSQALKIIASEANSRFDPQLSACFVEFVKRQYWERDDFLAFLEEEAVNNDYVRVRQRLSALIADARDQRVS